MGRPPAAFVGRDDALGVLRTAVRRASGGHPSVLIVTGETGVGKTRLVRELIEQERVTLLAGSCVPMAGDPLPFAPLTQALRRLDRTGTLNLQLERLPELARLVPGIAPAKTTRTADLAAASQLGLFQSVLDLVDRLGAAAPVLHVIEDVHWADRSTLDLVRFLATNLTNERAVLLVTLRADAVVPATPLALWVAELARLENTERVELNRLGHEATARLVRQLAGDAADPEFVETTLARSAGNPLFAEQLVMQAAQNPGHPALLPATLHELLHARVHALPEDTQSVLRAAAVIGRPALVPLLAATTGTLVEQTETLLRPAMDQHVVEIRRDDTIAFRHPAFGEVVYAELMPAERQRLHRAAAEALEPAEGLGTGQRSSVAGDAVSGELARHWFGAGDSERALDAAVAAGWAAERMFAFADAYTNFTRAIALMDEITGTEHDRVRLLKHAGQAASLVGDSPEAVRLVESALALATDPPARAALLTRLGLIHYRAGRGSLTEKCLREALSLLPPDEESVLVARIHAGLALFGAAWSRLDLAEQSCRRGLEVARKVGARREEGLLVNAGPGRVGPRRHRVRREAAAPGLGHRARGRQPGRPCDGLRQPHPHPRARRPGRRDRRGRPRGRRRPHPDGPGPPAGQLPQVQPRGGPRQRGADRGGRPGDRRGGVAASPRGHGRSGAMQAGRVAMMRGDLDEAWEWLEQARVIVEAENAPESYRRNLIETEAEVELWAGRPVAAYDLVVDGLDLVAGTDEAAYAGTLVALGLRALATEAEAHRDRESRKRLSGMRRPLDDARAWPAANQPERRRRATRGRGPRPPGWSSPVTPPRGAGGGGVGGAGHGRSPGRTRGGGRRRPGSTPGSTRRRSTPARRAYRGVGAGRRRGSCRSANGWPAGTASTSSRSRSRPSRTRWTSTG